MTGPVAMDDWAQTYRDCGYGFCRPCREWHRPPECPIDEQGRPLNGDGVPWDDQTAVAPQDTGWYTIGSG